MMRISSTLILAVLILSYGSAAVQADVINYGDFAGTNVTFNQVTESSFEVGALFGEPSVNGDALDFLAPSFQAQVANGAIELIDGLLTFTITANEGTTFDSINFSEFGTFFDVGMFSTSSVFLDAFVMTDDGVFNDTDFFTNFGDGSGDWSTEVKIEFPETTFATVALTNILFTFADIDGEAFVGKDGITIDVKTTVIPEPTTLGILALAGFGILSRRRR